MATRFPSKHFDGWTDRRRCLHELRHLLLTERDRRLVSLLGKGQVAEDQIAPLEIFQHALTESGHKNLLPITQTSVLPLLVGYTANLLLPHQRLASDSALGRNIATFWAAGRQWRWMARYP
jgi:hypothetical protein